MGRFQKIRNIKRRREMAMMNQQYSRKFERKLRNLKEKRNERNKMIEENEKGNEQYDELPDWLNAPFPLNKDFIIPPSVVMSSFESEEWKEVPVPSRRCMVEAVPPEEEKLIVLLENFHLSPESPVPPPQEETHSPIDREWYDALIWRENRRKHPDDCLITRVVRQSKLTEFFKPKKNN